MAGSGERKLLRKPKIFIGFKVLFLCKEQLKESRISQCSNFPTFQKQNELERSLRGFSRYLQKGDTVDRKEVQVRIQWEWTLQEI